MANQKNNDKLVTGIVLGVAAILAWQYLKAKKATVTILPLSPGTYLPSGTASDDTLIAGEGYQQYQGTLSGAPRSQAPRSNNMLI